MSIPFFELYRTLGIASEKTKIRLEKTSRMCYHNNKRDTDERFHLPFLTNCSVHILEGCGTEQFFFIFGKRILLLVSICNIEDKCDDCNDDHAVRKQHLVCNHLHHHLFARRQFRQPLWCPSGA